MALALSLGISRAAELRGIWVDAFGPGFLNANEVRQLVHDCRNYNFNAVFVEMRKRGDAFYFPSSTNLEPRSTALAKDFDALATIIHECHASSPRIEVHCWLVSHFVWAWKRPPPEPGHVFNLHPEFLTKDSIDEKWVSNGYYLDPGNPGANLWIHDVATDIASHYKIDGLHWDYFRYPCQDSGYNETAINRYNEEFGTKARPAPDDPRFCEWRRRQVTDFLRWVNSDLLEINPNLVLSAAVFSSRDDAYRSRFSDWPTWNREGLLDICIPMDFSDDTGGIFIPRVNDALANCGIRNVCIGQAGYKNSKENTLTQLNYARTKGSAGIVFYSYRMPTSVTNSEAETFAYLRDNFQPTWTTTPELAWKRKTGILKGTVIRGGNKSPLYNAEVLLKRESFDHDLQNDVFDQSGVVPDREVSIRTDPHGKYAFFNLEPGEYSLTASSKDGSKIDSVKINPGRVSIKDFVLRINQPLSGTSNAQSTRSD